MKRLVLTATVVAGVGLVVWATPPLRRAVQTAASEFRDAYIDKEREIRSALMSETLPLTY